MHAKRRDPARDPGVQLANSEVTLPAKGPRSILVFPCNRRDTYAGLRPHAEADDSTRFIRPSWIQRSFVRTMLLQPSSVYCPGLGPESLHSRPVTCFCIHLPFDDHLWNIWNACLHNVRRICIYSPRGLMTKRKSASDFENRVPRLCVCVIV